MALRDKLRDRAQPFLEPGETVQQVFLAQTGPNPLWVILTYLVFFKNRYYIGVVTDRAIVLIRASAWKPASPKQGLTPTRLPRETQIGPVSGLWASSLILDKKLWINRRFHKDVEAADAARPGLPAPTGEPLG